MKYDNLSFLLATLLTLCDTFWHVFWSQSRHEASTIKCRSVSFVRGTVILKATKNQRRKNNINIIFSGWKPSWRTTGKEPFFRTQRVYARPFSQMGPNPVFQTLFFCFNSSEQLLHKHLCNPSPRRLKALGNHAVFEPERVRGAQRKWMQELP